MQKLKNIIKLIIMDSNLKLKLAWKKKGTREIFGV